MFIFCYDRLNLEETERDEGRAQAGGLEGQALHRKEGLQLLLPQVGLLFTTIAILFHVLATGRPHTAPALYSDLCKPIS